MNKERLIVIGAVLVAAGAGFGGGYLTAQKLLEKKYAEQAQHDIDDVKAHYQERLKALENQELKGDSPKPSTTEEEIRLSQELAQQIKANIEANSIIREEDYTRDAEPDTAAVEAAAVRRSKIPEDRTRPYVIDEAGFAEDRLDFNKIDLTYYLDDGVLVDDQCEIITDRDYVVGDDNLDRLDELDTKLGSLYIRNERIASDYEITISHESYMADVVGFVDEKPRIRKMREADE